MKETQSRALLIENTKSVEASLVRDSLIDVQLSCEGVQKKNDWLSRARDSSFNIILIAAGKDSLDIIQRLRREEIHTPILCLIGKKKPQERIEALDLGADVAVPVSVTKEELVARLKALLRRSAKTDYRMNEIVFADLRLDPVDHKVWRGNIEIPLSKAEYAIFKHFMIQPGKVVSPNSLAESISKEEMTIFSNLIAVYISYLRSKLQVAPDSPPLIFTVRGKGYVLGEVVGAEGN